MEAPWAGEGMQGVGEGGGWPGSNRLGHRLPSAIAPTGCWKDRMDLIHVCPATPTIFPQAVVTALAWKSVRTSPWYWVQPLSCEPPFWRWQTTLYARAEKTSRKKDPIISGTVRTHRCTDTSQRRLHVVPSSLTTLSRVIEPLQETYSVSSLSFLRRENTFLSYFEGPHLLDPISKCVRSPKDFICPLIFGQMCPKYPKDCKALNVIGHCETVLR